MAEVRVREVSARRVENCILSLGLGFELVLELIEWIFVWLLAFDIQ